MKEISTQFSLNSREFFKGLKLAVLGSLAGYLKNIFDMPSFDFMTAFNDWHSLLNGAILAGGLYLVKTFLEGSKSE